MKEAKTTEYRSIAISLDHPLAQNAGNGNGKVYEHRFVLFNKIGSGIHKCYWCKKDVSWDDETDRKLVADHLDNNKWNNSPDNLVASCWRCNFARATRPDFLTHCEHGHKWTEENTYIRPDGTGRQCKQCNKKNCKERYHKNREKHGHSRKIPWYEIIPEVDLYQAIDAGLSVEEMLVAFNTCTYTLYKAMKEYGIR